MISTNDRRRLSQMLLIRAIDPAEDEEKIKGKTETKKQMMKKSTRRKKYVKRRALASISHCQSSESASIDSPLLLGLASDKHSPSHSPITSTPQWIQPNNGHELFRHLLCGT